LSVTAPHETKCHYYNLKGRFSSRCDSGCLFSSFTYTLISLDNLFNIPRSTRSLV
jgi:hypothetical protein